MRDSLDERDAYVQAEVATALAHQIRAIRLQRGWSQGELARRMGTRQHVVSRLEDPGYGRHSLQTLMLLSRVFDAGLQVRFVSFVTMLQETFTPRHEECLVPAFEEEADQVGFYSPASASLALDNVPAVYTIVEQQASGAVVYPVRHKFDATPGQQTSPYFERSES